MKSLYVAMLASVVSVAAFAKLPAPSDEAKAKAAEAAAKTAHAGKVDNFLLCKYQDKSAAHYYKTAKASATGTKPAAALPPCADPGPFVYKPDTPATTAVASAAPAPAAPKDAKKP